MNYPIVLDLQGKAVLVVGGGKVATRKVARLLEVGALVTVVSPIVTERIRQWASEGRLLLSERLYCAEDVLGHQLVFAATNSPSVNKKVLSDAHQSGSWVNVADGNRSGDFMLPALLSLGGLRLAIDTGGASPALSKKLRQYLTDSLHPGWGQAVAIFAALRPLVRPLKDEQTRRDFWRRLVDQLPDAAMGTVDEISDWLEEAAQGSGLDLAPSLIRTALITHGANTAKKEGNQRG